MRMTRCRNSYTSSMDAKRNCAPVFSSGFRATTAVKPLLFSALNASCETFAETSLAMEQRRKVEAAMAAGRLIFGLGAESMIVAVTAVLGAMAGP